MSKKSRTYIFARPVRPGTPPSTALIVPSPYFFTPLIESAINNYAYDCARKFRMSPPQPGNPLNTVYGLRTRPRTKTVENPLTPVPITPLASGIADRAAAGQMHSRHQITPFAPGIAVRTFRNSGPHTLRAVITTLVFRLRIRNLRQTQINKLCTAFTSVGACAVGKSVKH